VRTQSKLCFELAQDSDYTTLCEMHHAAYRDVVKKQFGRWDTQEQDWFFEQSWQRNAHQLILWREKLCGYCCVIEHGDALELAEIVLSPIHQGFGLGSRVLEHLMKQAELRSVPLKLQVLRQSRAVSFYERLGFQRDGESANHIKMCFRPNS